MLLANAGSKNEVSKATLRTCRCRLQNLQETSTTQISRVRAFKKELAQSLAKAEERRKINQLNCAAAGRWKQRHAAAKRLAMVRFAS
jgi:hypothetical protein